MMILDSGLLFLGHLYTAKPEIFAFQLFHDLGNFAKITASKYSV